MNLLSTSKKLAILISSGLIAISSSGQEILKPQPVEISIVTEEFLADVGKLPDDYFAIGGVGYEGKISEGEAKFRALIQKEDPITDFNDWYEYGTEENRLYCMLAYFHLDKARYHKIKEEKINKGIEVGFMSGCILSTVPIEKVLEQIENGTYNRILDKEKK